VCEEDCDHGYECKIYKYIKHSAVYTSGVKCDATEKCIYGKAGFYLHCGVIAPYRIF
jgi:hypothetical protein